MSSPRAKTVSRRAFLGLSAAAAGGASWYVPTEWVADSSAKRTQLFRELLVATTRELNIPCNSAEVFLRSPASKPSEQEVDGLVVLLQQRLGPEANDLRGWPIARLHVTKEEFTAALARAIQEDFLDDHTCNLDGWLLSRTECRVAALKYLLEKQSEGRDSAESCLAEEDVAAGGAPRIEKLHPQRTGVGRGFNIQPSGDSALAVDGSGFEPGAVIRFDGTPLPTTYGNSQLLSAHVPAEFYSAEGVLEVTVQNTDGKISNPVEFSVVSGVAPGH